MRSRLTPAILRRPFFGCGWDRKSSSGFSDARLRETWLRVRFGMKKWLARFACAFRGLGSVLTREPSGRVHAVCALAVVALGLALHVSTIEWAVLALATGSVIAAEAFNSAIERLADRVTREREEAIRILKDTAAGAVLAASIGAALAALAIFGPKLVALL